MEYRYSLQKYKYRDKSLLCPKCGRKNCFTPYVDNFTGGILDPTVGMCNHQHSCAYHYTPRQWFEDNRLTNGLYNKSENSQNQMNNTNRKSFSDYNTAYNNRKRLNAAMHPSPYKSLSMNTVYAKSNAFAVKDEYDVIHYVILRNSPFYSSLPQFIRDKEHKVDGAIPVMNGGGHYLADALIRKHFSIADISNANSVLDVCGINDYRTLYYQIDLLSNIRTAKIIEYNPFTGHRVKEKGASWLHSELIKGGYLNENFRLQQVPFGLRNVKEMFLMNNALKIAVYEAEKTAYIMTLINKEGWLHCSLGGKNYLKSDMILPFKELGVKQLYLFPDKGCYGQWQEKSAVIEHEVNIDITVSNYLENTSLPDGSDMADLFI